MKPNILFIGWNRAITGREGQAGEQFQSMLGFLGKQQAAGKIESFEPVIIGVHGGDMNGFVVVRGKTQALFDLKHSEEFVDLIIKTGLCVDGFGVVEAYGGEALQQVMMKWGAAAAGA